MSWIVESFLNLAQAISSYISQALETLIDCIFYTIQLRSLSPIYKELSENRSE